MKKTLLQELNEATREKSEFEKALAEAEMEFDMDLSGGDEPPMDDDDMDPDEFDYDNVELDDDELRRIADYCEQECADMSDDEVADKIGDDLEQLDYSPEEISAGINRVMDMLGRDAPQDDPMDDMDDEMVDDMDDMGGEEPRF